MKYQNISQLELVLPHIGSVKPEGVIETTEELNNPYLKFLDGSKAPETSKQSLSSSDQKDQK